MATSVNYWIYSVRYNAEHTHIDRVRGYPASGGSFGNHAEWTRKEVVNLIEQGYAFATMFKGSDGNWKKGEDVRIITVNNVKFLRTDSNSKAADNLGNLPEF